MNILAELKEEFLKFVSGAPALRPKLDAAKAEGAALQGLLDSPGVQAVAQQEPAVAAGLQVVTAKIADGADLINKAESVLAAFGV